MTPQLPALDPYLSSVGEPLEDLSRIAASQPFRSAGPSLDRADVEALVTLDRTLRLRRTAPAGLVAAGLVDERGRLTDDGRTVTAALTSPTGRLRVESARGSTPLVLDVYLRSGWALVLSTASPAALTAPPRGEDIVTTATGLGLDYVDVAQVPTMIASWVGLAPAWSLATSPQDLPESLVRRRVDDPGTPPPASADANLRHAWEQPWFLWTLQAASSPTGRVLVNAGRAGHFALTQPTGAPGADAGAGSGTDDERTVGFRAAPSASLWRDLVRLVAEAAGT